MSLSAFFDSWSEILRVCVVGVLAYIALVVFLRVSGNRTLSKLNAFDLVVTIALGSTLATILLNKSVSLAEGVTALGLLIGLQFVVTWTSVRWGWVRAVVTGEPRVLVRDGAMDRGAMRRARITEAEVRAALRDSGIPGPEGAARVVLETDGSVTCVPRS